jgi:putative ABC transport system ATP-binding protein
MNPDTKNNNKNIVFNLKNVVKKREKGGNLFELNIESFEILEGEFIAIVGESGCGKSTLLDMLGLVLKPTNAAAFSIRNHQNVEYDIMGASESELANIRKSHIGYVLQTGGLLSFLSVRENIFLPCAINNMDGMESHINALVKRLKIENQMPKKPQFLSGGQRQRVAIARALSHRPPVVLADEPTAAVDKHTANDIMSEFKTLTREMGVTLLMVTHDIHLVENVADRMFTFWIDPDKKTEQYTLSSCIEKYNFSQHKGQGE